MPANASDWHHIPPSNKTLYNTHFIVPELLLMTTCSRCPMIPCISHLMYHMFLQSLCLSPPAPNVPAVLVCITTCTKCPCSSCMYHHLPQMSLSSCLYHHLCQMSLQFLYVSPPAPNVPEFLFVSPPVPDVPAVLVCITTCARFPCSHMYNPPPVPDVSTSLYVSLQHHTVQVPGANFVNGKDFLGCVYHFWQSEVQRSRSSQDHIWAHRQLWIHYVSGINFCQSEGLVGAVLSINENFRSISQSPKFFTWPNMGKITVLDP